MSPTPAPVQRGTLTNAPLPQLGAAPLLAHGTNPPSGEPKLCEYTAGQQSPYSGNSSSSPARTRANHVVDSAPLAPALFPCVQLSPSTVTQAGAERQPNFAARHWSSQPSGRYAHFGIGPPSPSNRAGMAPERLHSSRPTT